MKKKLQSAKSLKMSRQANPSAKAIKERNFRKREKTRKHFEGPLRRFIEYKYRNIFEEYVQLYNIMVANHPGKRNLVKTKTFRDWMMANKESPPATDILSTDIRETFGQNYIEGDEAVNPQGEDDEAVNPQGDGDEAVNPQGDGDEAVNPQSEDDEGVDPNVLAYIEGQVDAVMNEIIQDEEWRNLLNSEIEDEGIEITPDDDIIFDIEPFDFELEVEQYQW